MGPGAEHNEATLPRLIGHYQVKSKYIIPVSTQSYNTGKILNPFGLIYPIVFIVIGFRDLSVPLTAAKIWRNCLTNVMMYRTYWYLQCCYWF